MANNSLASTTDSARDAVNKASGTVGNAVHSTAEAARNATYAASDRLTDTSERVSRVVKRGADVAADSTHRAVNAAAEHGAALLDSAQETAQHQIDKANQQFAGLQRFVERNPLSAIAAAAGIGLLLGLMARR